MNRNSLYVIIALLVVAIAGYALYLHEQNKPGLELKANEDGISIKKN
jgi:hypothetical protein